MKLNRCNKYFFHHRLRITVEYTVIEAYFSPFHSLIIILDYQLWWKHLSSYLLHV